MPKLPKAPKPIPAKPIKPLPKEVEVPKPLLKKPKTRISLTWFRRRKTPFISEKTEIKPTTLKFGLVTEKVEIPEVLPKKFAEEAQRIKRIIEARKAPPIYKPTFYGYLANLIVRRFSFFLLNSFPGFFKKVYNNLRSANIKILSNTYVNMMVFYTGLALIISLIVGLAVSSFMGILSLTLFLKTLFTSIVISFVVFTLFYTYPTTRTASRRRSIDSNITFAIQHMSAVASSGVPPVNMFRLIASSTEYGEVSVETEKVVEYVELFGYDLITAIRSVAAVTPSSKLKEFLDGMISTVESGSELTKYLNEKANESLSTYQTERKRYIETIATYSDIYTGIMIAAPLFFIAALSLVNMLGGAIAGINVNTLITLGTYIIIPLLNIFFMIFLQITQPGM